MRLIKKGIRILLQEGPLSFIKKTIRFFYQKSKEVVWIRLTPLSRKIFTHMAERKALEKMSVYTGEQMIPDYEPQDWNRRVHYARYLYALGFVGPSCTVLDAGCGSGYGTQLIALKTSGKCFGVDYRKDIIDYARKRYPATNLTYKVAKLDDKVDLGKFDVCLSFDVFEHIKEESLDIYLTNLSNTLKTGTSPLLISTPQSSKKDNRGGLGQFHVREYTFDEFYEKLSKYFIVDHILFRIGMTAVCYRK